MKTPVLAALAFGIVLAGLGCATDRRTPPIAAPLDLSDPKLARGQVVYYRECHMCHPHGGAGLGPAVVNKPLPGPLMKLQVRTGLGAMPSFPEEKISAADLDALIEYIKAVHANKPRAL